MEVAADSAPAMASETGQLLGVWQNGQIIGLALVEGAVFFGLVTYFVTGHWLGLAVGVIGLGLLAAHFPSDDRPRTGSASSCRGSRSCGR